MHEISVIDYYASQGIMTEPGKHIDFYEGLPPDVPELVKITQGLVIHASHSHLYGIKLSEDKRKEAQIRRVEGKITRIKELDSGPITSARKPDMRIAGNCRDFAVFSCSLLRHQDIPARVRCGFETYFHQGKYADHWICEYWNEGESSWVKFDPSADSVRMNAHNLKFDPNALPPGKFYTPGEIWKLCMSGKLDSELCGYFGKVQLKGLWFIRGNLVRDFMALNKLEVLPTDCNDFISKDSNLRETDYPLLNKVAELTTNVEENFTQIRSLYESESRLRMPKDWKLWKSSV